MSWKQFSLSIQFRFMLESVTHLDSTNFMDSVIHFLSADSPESQREGCATDLMRILCTRWLPLLEFFESERMKLTRGYEV